jgi:DNA-binding response OmpR family regulator
MRNGLKRFRLLVVDDEPVLRAAIAQDLEDRGFTVFSAENGRKALEIARSQDVDLVVSDLRMPGGDGIELLKKLRESHPVRPKVVFVTGFTDEDDERELMKWSPQVLRKPFAGEELASAVYSALELDAAGAPT